MQQQMGRPTLKLIQEVDTRWNSTFDMFQRLYDQREPVGAALSNLENDVSPLSCAEYEVIHEALFLLQPFKAATTELSEEKRVSASKVIPLYRMLQHNLLEKLRHSKQPATQQLGTFLKDGPQARCGQYETVRPLALATLLDPRFKNLGFGNPAKAQEAEKQLILECATLIQPAETSDGCAVGPTLITSLIRITGCKDLNPSHSGFLWFLVAMVTTVRDVNLQIPDWLMLLSCFMMLVETQRQEVCHDKDQLNLKSWFWV
ncbi:zinc finger BED domain-containing protein 4-like [Sphaeramia orbicularis]|uniref:zinc finger BED domain-containing protein 4-like n=1 Tax=Sphaeramia orbicularis TaxID=375764 RepID=UPI00117D17BC|nr:zinc finger BED domain-containing protein 4-like [Sphaeramia orbicularis]